MANSVFCVNTHSKEFKDTAKRLDVNEGQLEATLHEYFNRDDVTDKETYPSDEYLKEQWYGKPFVGSEDQIRLWEDYYSSPVTAQSKESAESFRNYVSQFFLPSSIGIIKNSNGTYTIQIAKPLSRKSLLWRGVPHRPTIDSEGNLVLRPSYDNLFGGYGISFANDEDAANQYGRRQTKDLI